ncbi:hypothetical protein LG296_06795 [Ureibacillus chungkukjangi]|uniref:hypothetical protein n=1 Tax=Ureibacillus chungkukjangi TaxID=1202712 RepID=UPI003851503E
MKGIDKARFITLNLLVFTLILAIVVGQYKQKTEKVANAEVASTYLAVSTERQEKQRIVTNQLHETINRDLPGFIVWDSAASGAVGNSVTYPLILKELISQHVYNDIPVEVQDTSNESNQEYKNYIPIIFLGQSDNFETKEQMIEHIKLIVNNYNSHEKYLVLGLTSGTAKSRMQLESYMASAFGERYVNLRELVSTNGLKIAKLNPTYDDIAAMGVGSVPPSLLSKKENFNEKGNEVIGKIIYDRIQKLGYFDSVQQLVKELESL